MADTEIGFLTCAALGVSTGRLEVSGVKQAGSESN